MVLLNRRPIRPDDVEFAHGDDPPQNLLPSHLYIQSRVSQTYLVGEGSLKRNYSSVGRALRGGSPANPGPVTSRLAVQGGLLYTATRAGGSAGHQPGISPSTDLVQSARGQSSLTFF